MTRWYRVFDGQIGLRRIRVEQASDDTLRAYTTMTDAPFEVEIISKTLGELKHHLMEEAEFSEEDASEIVNRVMYH